MVLLAVGVVAGTVRVPLVALAPGPTFDVMGEVEGKTVVTINGRPTYPTTGRLNMTTVAVTDGLTAMTALRFWADGDRQLVPREILYPPGKSDQQVEQENNQLFTNSENDAEVAALSYLNEPVKVFVGQIGADAPAASVLKAGDQLVSLKGQQISSPSQVNQIMTTTRPGDQVPVGYLHGDNQVRTGTVTVGAYPNGPQGFLGIVMKGEPEDPNQILISLGDVGGPSAGLTFALAVIDKLTPGDLLRGRAVAGTGEILSTGGVQPIGGIGLKMIAAKRDGASVFLVPAANCAEAKMKAPEGLQLIKVATLAEAVSSLTALNEGRTPAGC
ncbi:YlbL family protein [Pseudonocardia acaciae]|uniref:YlbL family protein n=1 Tax=Pseudonocardia acaciae TaxID=551276 RepID=UPI000687A56D|nr:S16 family serine protease [Pseudonocardia acaciae]